MENHEMCVQMSSSDPRSEGLKEYMQLFSSHFRDAINTEVDMYIASIANYLRVTTTSGDLQIINSHETKESESKPTMDEDDGKRKLKEELENLKAELEKAHLIIGILKSTLKLSNAVIEKNL